jgi:ribosomal 30S subunit maturation factor RimM
MELDGLTDIDEALLLKNKTVYAARKDFKLAKGEYFICDIISIR